MPSFHWTAEEIEIYLEGAKKLLSINTAEDVEKYDLLRESKYFLLYLRACISSQKGIKDKEVLSRLNAIICRLFENNWECSTFIENSFLDLILWIPETILNELHKNREKLCLMIESESDIEINNSLISISSPHQPIMKWVSRSKFKINAEVLTSPSLELIEIYKNRYGIGFQNSCMYIAKNISLSLHENVLLCSTFYCRDLVRKNQLILSDFHPYFSKNKFRGFSLNEKRVVIHGVNADSNSFTINDFMIDEKQEHKWITLMIIWNGSQSQSFYKISKGSINQKPGISKEGFFTSNDLGIFESTEITIGGKHPNIKDVKFENFNGVISNIEVWISPVEIPTELCNLIFDSQNISSNCLN